VAKYPSQNKAAQSLKGTSSGTISTVLSGKWDMISEDMWRKIDAQIGGPSQDGWQIVETKAYTELTTMMGDAQMERNITWMVGEAGCGKSTAARCYAQDHREVFYVLCDEDMKKSDFMRETAQAVGIRIDGYRIRTLMGMIVDAIIQMDSPLLIFDEADKLKDDVFHYFINFSNRLEERCGIIFLSTSYIEQRMKRGLRCGKKGYKEIESRIGRKFFELEETNGTDIYSICRANGLTEEKQIEDVMRDAEKYDNDLRRVKKAVHRVKKMND
jgi:hypothetical protein